MVVLLEHINVKYRIGEHRIIVGPETADGCLRGNLNTNNRRILFGFPPLLQFDSNKMLSVFTY